MPGTNHPIPSHATMWTLDHGYRRHLQENDTGEPGIGSGTILFLMVESQAPFAFLPAMLSPQQSSLSPE
jgi:hypothetical protein